jgi:RND family efflux transporter MFP subunit
MRLFLRTAFSCLLSLLLIVPLGSVSASEEIIRIQLKPSQEARINSPLSGRIIAVNYRDGDAVKKGQTLIKFDCSEKHATLAQTQARMNRQSQLLVATQSLFDLGSASETQLGVLSAELDEAKATKDFATAQVKKCSVNAPFSGYVSGLFVKNHFSVQEGEAMIELVGNGEKGIEMIVPSKWMRWLKPDIAFKIEIDETAKSYGAVITRMGGRVDPVTQSVKAYAKLTQDAPELLTGMSGQALFEQNPSNADNNDGE